MPSTKLKTLRGGLLALALCQSCAGTAVAGDRLIDAPYVALGITGVSEAWKSQHARDENFLYVLDSRSGLIEVCSDVETVCRFLAGSQRDPLGAAVGRFAGVKISRATKAWKAVKPSDDHLIYTLDTSTAQIQICGDTDGGCAIILNGALRPIPLRPKVVMLYRRADSSGVAGRIYDRLVAHYGADAVFMDVYNVPFSANWREQVNNMSLNGGVLVALIGPRWLGPLPDGKLRIDDVYDPVRMELETALRAGIPVFPVLVEGSVMPRSAELPDSLKGFADLNAALVDNGRDFDHHVGRLISAIDRRLANRGDEGK
jgi:hypothetical protein